MRVRLIDFGICQRYMDKHGQHYKQKYVSKFMGTLHYVSINVMNGLHPSRRDDLISLAYMLLTLLNESPFDNVTEKGKSLDYNFNKILEFKSKLTL